MKKSIAVIVAHADDIELGAGGTLAKYIADGYQALYGVLSRCNSGWTITEEKGGHYTSSLEITPQRHAEAESAAKVFGAEFYHGDLLENCYTRRDGSCITPSFTGVKPLDEDVPEGVPMLVACGAGARQNHPTVLEVTDLLIKFEPELVIGQGIQDRNPDHFAAAMIVAKAWKAASKKVKIGPYWIPMRDKPEDLNLPSLVADQFVDVTGHEEKCLKALACHKTQGMHLPRNQERAKNRWKKHGKKIGCTSAEGFIQVYPTNFNLK